MAIAGFICLGIFFRLYNLDRKVLWEDEIFGTVHLLGYTEAEIVQAAPSFAVAADLQRFFRLPIPSIDRGDHVSDTIRSLAREDPQHPPLYYVIGHLWAQRFGSSVAALRGLSAIFGILALVCMYFLCMELFASRVTAWLGAAIVAVSPFHVLYAQEVREYSLWTVVILLMSLTFLRAIRLRTKAAWGSYFAVFALGMYVYPFSALVALGDGAFLIFVDGFRPTKRLWAFVSATLSGLALFLPWLLIMLRSEGLNRGMAAILTAHVSPLNILATLIRDVRGAFIDFGLFVLGPLTPSTFYPAVTLGVIVLIVSAVVSLVRSKEWMTLSFALLALCLPTAPLVLHDLAFGGELVSQSRYFMPLYLGIELLLIAALRGALSVVSVSGWQQTAARAALMGVLIIGALSCAVSSQAQTCGTKDFEQNRMIAAIVNGSNDPLVVSDFYTSRTLGLGYYLHPTVKLRVNLLCDQCTLPPAPRTNLLNASTTAGDVFLLGPSAELERSAEQWAATAGRGSRIRTIDVLTFPDRATQKNLTLFAPI